MLPFLRSTGRLLPRAGPAYRTLPQRLYSDQQPPSKPQANPNPSPESEAQEPTTTAEPAAPTFKPAQSIYDLDPLLMRPSEPEPEPESAADQPPSSSAEGQSPPSAPGGNSAHVPAPSGLGLNRRRGTHERHQQSSKGTADPEASRKGYVFLTIGALGGLAGFYHLGRPFDPRDEATIKKAGIDETQLSPWAAYWQRAKFRVGDYQSYFSKPAWDYLLPEPLPEQYQRPYTLLINLDETLVYSSWDIDHGWRTAKRPGVDYFLGYMSKFYEIVLFTTQPSYVAMPIIEKLDPYGYIMYHLYRESTRYDDGTYIKDISKLNRDLSKVIAVDSNPAAYSAQPSNLLSLKPWKGDPDDTGLIALIPFLEYLAMNDVADVRKVLDFYRGKDVATEFNNWEKHLKEELRLRWLEDKEKKAQGLSGWLGMGSGQADEDEPPKPFFEQNRIALRKAFEDEQATIKEHAEAERKRMMEEQAQQLKDMKLTMWKIIKEGGVPQPPNPNSSESQQPPKA